MNDNHSLQVLVLEDNKHDFKLIQRVLNQHLSPCQVDQITKISDLPNNTNIQKYNVILIDSRLPDGTGLDAIKYLKQNNTNIPTIHISGSENVQEAVEAIQLGGYDYILKDISGNYLKLLPQTIRRAHLHYTDQQTALRLQKALADTQEKYRTIIENTSSIVFTIDQDGNFTFVNPTTTAVTGYTSKELIGTHFTNLIVPEWRKPTLKFFLQQITNQTSQSTKEFPINTKDGEMRWMLQTTDLQFNDGQFISGQGTVQDITDRINAEQSRAKIERRFRGLFEKTYDAVFLLDLSMVCIMVNNRAADMLGYRQSELVGMKAKHIIAPAEQEDTLNILEKLKISDVVPPFERTLLRKDGKPIYVEITASLVDDGTGTPLHAQAIVRDITHRKMEALELEHRASHDALTGLANRDNFETALKEIISYAKDLKTSVALFFVDLDGFKQVNDMYGHDAGDILLQIVSKRLLANVRVTDVVARIGGDEFTIILNDISTKPVLKIAQNILETLNNPFSLGEKNQVNIGASIGIAFYPNHAQTPEDLIKAADEAMYQAKKSGKNRINHAK